MLSPKLQAIVNREKTLVHWYHQLYEPGTVMWSKVRMKMIELGYKGAEVGIRFRWETIRLKWNLDEWEEDVEERLVESKEQEAI